MMPAQEPSIETVHALLKVVNKNVQELKISKLDSAIHQKDLELITSKMDSIESVLRSFKTSFQAVATALIVAFLTIGIQEIVSR